MQDIPPASYMQDKDIGAIAAIHLSGTKALRSTSAGLSGAGNIEADSDISGLIKKIIAAAHDMAGADPLYAVITGDDPAVLEKVRQRSRKEMPFAVFYLQGGMAAYEAHVRMQARLQEPGTIKAKSSKCATCG
jgi:hypothetical protein